MSTVVICPSCGGKSRLKEKAGKAEYTAIQDQEAFQKIGQLKKVLEKFKTKAEMCARHARMCALEGLRWMNLFIIN
tara:strand:- start:3583 stop:3810 length:228 start_codon:yes stop_codon:yes gene_type:complete